MTKAFQDSLLKYLFQNTEAKQYRDSLDMSVFESPTSKLVYELWQAYVTKYGRIPPKPAFLEYTDRDCKRHRASMSHELYSDILNTIAIVYSPDTNDYQFTRDVIIEFARRRETRNLFTSKADKIKSATVDDIDAIYSEMRRITMIGGDTTETNKNRGGFLFKDMGVRSKEVTVHGHPTFLQTLNKMTAAGGFYTPQHILFMGGPKAFKTGLMICLMVEYARAGLKVFAADAENGVTSYRIRLKQCMAECERHEVPIYHQELKMIADKIKLFGGDIVTHFFPSGSTLDEVELELERLSTEENWQPNVIFYDPLYLFAPVNKRIYEQRLKIQDLNKHAIRLNNKFNTFSFTAAKVKADAVNKLVLKKNDLGEDFTQNYDAHAIFALCRTESEEADGYGRIVPVSQREGISYVPGPMGTCAIKIDSARNTITELNSEVYLATLEEEHQSKGQKHKRKYIPPQTLKDE